jgi:hypothetical protein
MCSAPVAPEWVRAHVPTEWVEQYGERLEHERLAKEEEERQQYANQVGANGWMLLDALQAPATADWMKPLPAIMMLRTIWEQPFEPRDQGGQWQAEPALPTAELINSPCDLDNSIYDFPTSEPCAAGAPPRMKKG